MSKNLVGEPFRVSLISGMATFYASEGYDTVFRRFFVSQNRKTSQRNPSVLCVRKILVAKKFMGNRGGGEYQDFASKKFCLTMPKNLVGYPFRVSLISGIENIYASEGCHDFLSKFFVSQCREFS